MYIYIAERNEENTNSNSNTTEEKSTQLSQSTVHTEEKSNDKAEMDVDYNDDNNDNDYQPLVDASTASNISLLKFNHPASFISARSFANIDDYDDYTKQEDPRMLSDGRTLSLFAPNPKGWTNPSEWCYIKGRDFDRQTGKLTNEHEEDI